MRITPIDIKRQDFKKAFRGYDPVEVDTFLDMLSNEIEELLKQVRVKDDENITLAAELRNYKSIERTLQQTLAQAQEASSKSIENSRREAELIVQEAQMKASQIIEKARYDFSKMKEEIITLKARKESIISKLRVLLQSELDLLQALRLEDDDFNREIYQNIETDVEEALKKISHKTDQNS